MPNQKDISKAIRDNLSILDPQLNSALGTEVRDIIDSVANQIASSITDQSIMSYQFDLESYSGIDLHAYVSQFGFAPLRPTPSMGYLKVTRENGDSVIHIQPGTQFFRPATYSSPAVYFQSTSYEKMDEGELEVEIPVRAVVAGSSGNVPANTVTDVAGTSGITSVTNPLPMTGGRDTETDAQLRERFKKTIFRNLAGTQDQYMGLALAHAMNRRALLVGQVCRWSEVLTIAVNHTAVSTNTEVAGLVDAERSVWARNVDTDEFYQETGDFTFAEQVGAPPKLTVTQVVTSEDVVLVGSIASSLSHADLKTGTVVVKSQDGNTTYVEDTDYSIDLLAGTITRIPAGSITDGQTVDVNYTYYAIPQGTVIRLEYEYFSTMNRSVLGKTVELYVDGEDIIEATDMQFFNTTRVFTNDSGAMDKDNWSRESGSAPTVGNVFVPLASCPVDGLPSSIDVGAGISLVEGVDYWFVKDTTTLYGSHRAKDGIEFLATLFGTDPGEIPNETPFTAVYSFNRVVPAVQEIINRHTPVGTDTLVHAAKKRYLQVNLTVMYSVFPRAAIDSVIEDAVEGYFDTLPLGALVQFSDLEAAVAKVSGVDSVRVTLNTEESVYGVREFAADGETLLQTYTDDFALGTTETAVLLSTNIYSRTQETW